MIKKKHLMVSLWSSSGVIISILSTIIGFWLYQGWKEEDSYRKYRSFMSSIFVDILKKDIEISGVKATLIKSDRTSAAPEVEGVLKNNFSKILTRVALEVVFSTSEGVVLYREKFYPVGDGVFDFPPFLKGRRSGNILNPGGIIPFKFLITNCPQEAIAEFNIIKDKETAESSSGISLKVILSEVSVL
ncbi:hypothetical protein OMAG_002144 [Candidatus Omnitrophus magneticus]|uniref:Uncharacterized protein n=1 Tax=Candidatus Omnitrophus magneticus TaxID=1609969 RepID=A0A0F0CL40_9BACT|nr:hypothetical protein OMAG_002144 [Candidatus Omnitrophus magneticus]